MAITPTTAATKTTLASSAVNADLIAAANQSTATNANLAQNQGSAGNSKTNPPQGFEGPSTGLAGVNKPSADSLAPKTAADKQASVDQALGLVSKTDAIKSLAGVGTISTAASSAKDKLTDLSGSSKSDKPVSDQGFGNPSNDFGTNPLAGLNPMAAFQGGSVGGPLGAAAANSKPALTSGAAGSGLVSAEPAKDPDKKDIHPGPTSAANATTNKDGEVSEKIPTTPVKEDSFWQKLVKIFTGQTNIDGTKTERQKQLDQTLLEMPNPENTGSNVNILTQTLLDQLNAAKAGKPTSQGGSGDATPVDNGGIPQVVNNGSIAVNQGSINQRNLVGQPGGGAIGENVSGGNTGLNGFGRSNGAGAINPGPDAGSPGGDPRFQQDPGAALGGNQPAPPTPQLNGSANSTSNTPSEQTSSISATLGAGVRNLTLTGSATINGTGNALDNLINGNSAANELRGEVGNDSLDGKAGNDLLDGGAGRDQLTGGSGADRFRFVTPSAFGTAQADRITDFSRSEGDRIELSRSAFGLAAGTAVSFQTVNSDADLSRALGSSTLLVQDLRDGSILFNQNGTAAGAGQGGVFAVVSQGLTLQAGDFALGA